MACSLIKSGCSWFFLGFLIWGFAPNPKVFEKIEKCHFCCFLIKNICNFKWYFYYN